MPPKPYRSTIAGATWEYRLKDEGATIEGAMNPTKETLVVPAAFEDKSVITLNSYLFVPIDSPVKTIVLPSTLVEIGEKGANPFRNMIHLERIEFAAENAKYAVFDGAIYTKDFGELIAVPAGKKTIELAPGLKVIRNGALANAEIEGELILPESVEKIGDAAFMGARHLTFIAIPSAAIVSPSALSYCSAK